MSDTLNVFLLSILQGVAEFLPISSSGHLVLGKHLLGLESPGVRLEVALHVGTMFSVVAFYRVTVLRLVKGVFTGCRESWRMVLNIAVSAIPAVVLYVALKKVFRIDLEGDFFQSARMVGSALIFTGVVLLSLRWVPSSLGGEVTWRRAVAIGVAQAIALLPGISRSGMTISAGRISGVDAKRVAEFSFLMSLPLIAGAALKDALSSPPPDGAALPFGLLAVGAAVAGIIGYVALTLLVRLLRGQYFWLFGIYCLVVGGAVLCFVAP
ncbi:MAG: undecaprenyl-diphosphate phosphatase [Kiritimatiellaeota bacterium]|nr:undecaprenyl-diphosphate phosphatase [Kiritimatiellota bacterium]